MQTRGVPGQGVVDLSLSVGKLGLSKDRLGRDFVLRAMLDAGVDGGEGIVMRVHEH